ncbi:WXG100 family type VII secretion target [Nocardioides sp.]|uniref:WXG100 family type VII secretion target n=1 Tax=Nocardioides sp. TaxID=35761 RepID=UPI00272827FE|nr:WXG100 family type VII secretion target [Nocardioides sp.]MDO9456587.1 WXG100 family type VII secretion target [Nocardioides sp.]
MTGYAVDLDLLLDTIDALARCEDACDDGLDRVGLRVRALHDTWSGRTAEAQASAQAEWEAGFALVREGLGDMRRAAATARANYLDAIDANVRMWSL